jgi:3-hydroxybutyryl-CoA dehydratase
MSGQKNNMEARDLELEDIQIGDTVSFGRTISQEDVATFAALSGDFNPLHTDARYAETTQFKVPLVHGMFLAGLFSALVGMHLPGKRCLYLGQTLQFKRPVFAGDSVQVSGKVLTKSDSTRILTIATVIIKEDAEVVTGTATVQVLN